MNIRALALILLLCVAAPPADAADKRFLAFGDSNTFGHGDDGVRCFETLPGGYPPRLRTRLAARGLDIKIDNFGLCGETTAQGVTRIEAVLALGGDVIVIMEGTNDVSGGVSAETILFNLDVMARKAENAGIEPLMASVVPRGPGPERDTDNSETQFIAGQLKAASAAANRVFADPFRALFDRPNFFELHYFNQLHPNASGFGIVSDALVEPALEAAASEDLCAQVPPGPCVESNRVLCLNDGRFRLEATWENFFGETGVGTAVPVNADTGAFFWFDPQNIELTIKVLDGRFINDHFWVFYGALSNVKFSLLVTDTATGRCKEYFNPLGTFASVGDTAAFSVQ